MNIAVNTENSCFDGLPIICEVSVIDKPINASFNRVCLRVYVVHTNGSEKLFDFSLPVGDSDIVRFDISSAIRALAESHTPSPTELNVASCMFGFDVWQDYMIDGQLYSNVNLIQNNIMNHGPIYHGTLPDLMRLSCSLPTRWSLKPVSSPEIAFVGQKILSAGGMTYSSSSSSSSSDNGNLPSLQAPTVTESDVIAGSNNYYYGIPKPRDGYEIRFINSMGVLENVFIFCLRSVEVDIATDKHAIVRRETLSVFSRGYAKKKNDKERWKMSTGPLDQEWQEWYLHEFLTASWAWININGSYIPIHILPEETTPGIDRAKDNALTVEFTIEFDINGAII